MVPGGVLSTRNGEVRAAECRHGAFQRFVGFTAHRPCPERLAVHPGARAQHVGQDGVPTVSASEELHTAGPRERCLCGDLAGQHGAANPRGTGEHPQGARQKSLGERVEMAKPRGESVPSLPHHPAIDVQELLHFRHPSSLTPLIVGSAAAALESPNAVIQRSDVGAQLGGRRAHELGRRS